MLKLQPNKFIYLVPEPNDMKIKLVTIGKTHQSFVDEGVTEFEKRIVKYIPYEKLELPAVKIPVGISVEEHKKKEAPVLLKAINEGDYLVLLDERGRNYNSVEFSAQLQKMLNRGPKSVCFMIGGAYGFDESLYKRANEKIALSSLTFSHQLVRLVFAEQLYRALTIIKGEKYHH